MHEDQFDEIANQIGTAGLGLFREMVEAHLESEGDKFFIVVADSSGVRMHFRGDGSTPQFGEVDQGTLCQLAHLGFLDCEVTPKGTPNYRVTGGGRDFYVRLMQNEGSAVEQVEAEVRRAIDGSEYARVHPRASHHLREAFDLLWDRQTGDEVVSEVGEHLRKALMDATSDVVGSEAQGSQEKPIERLRNYLEGLALPAREAAVVSQIVELARVALSLDQRLNHIRDESDKGEPAMSWEELRRAAFATAFTCYELDRLRIQR